MGLNVIKYLQVTATTVAYLCVFAVDIVTNQVEQIVKLKWKQSEEKTRNINPIKLIVREFSGWSNGWCGIDYQNANICDEYWLCHVELHHFYGIDFINRYTNCWPFRFPTFFFSLLVCFFCQFHWIYSNSILLLSRLVRVQKRYSKAINGISINALISVVTTNDIDWVHFSYKFQLL